jgi:protein TonB
MQIALAASIAVHAGLLTLRIVDPERFNRVFEDTPLEVILVNAKTNEDADPSKAKAIAQTTLNGGGEAETGRATTPLPPSALTQVGDTDEEEATRKLESLQEQQNLMLATIKNQLAALPPKDPRPANKAESAEREQKRRQLIKLLAEIEKRINAENARPKKRYISPATREEVYAVYYDALRHTIEDRGTENFPTAKGKKLYGQLTMLITINHDGTVLDAEVVEPSDNPILDKRAKAIARSAGPFGRFTKAMRRQADQIVVVSRFKFTRDETLEANVSAAQ